MPNQYDTVLLVVCTPANCTFDLAHLARHDHGAYWAAEMASNMRDFATYYDSIPASVRPPLIPGEVQIKVSIVALPADRAKAFAVDAFAKADAHFVVGGDVRCNANKYPRRPEVR